MKATTTGLAYQQRSRRIRQAEDKKDDAPVVGAFPQRGGGSLDPPDTTATSTRRRGQAEQDDDDNMHPGHMAMMSSRRGVNAMRGHGGIQEVDGVASTTTRAMPSEMSLMHHVDEEEESSYDHHLTPPRLLMERPLVYEESGGTTVTRGTPPGANFVQLEPGAFRVDGPNPSPYDDLQDDRTLLSSLTGSVASRPAAATGAAAGATAQRASSGASSNRRTSSRQERGGVLPEPIEEAHVATAYLVEPEDETNRQTSAELRDRLEALTRSVQELALLRESSRSNNNNNNNNPNSNSSPSNPLEPLSEDTPQTIDPDGDQAERGSGLNAAAATTDAAAMSSSMSALGDSNSHMEGQSMSINSSDGVNTHAASLVEVLREDRERRQQERVARAERRAQIIRERKVAERKRQRRWYVIYFLIAVALAVSFYLVLSMGWADRALEKLGGKKPEGTETVTESGGGGSGADTSGADGGADSGVGIPAPGPVTGVTAAPTSVPVAMTEEETPPTVPAPVNNDPGTTETTVTTNTNTTTTGSNGTTTTINSTTTTSSTTTTTTTTTNNSLNSGMLPAVMGAGLGSGFFVLALACGFTTKTKVSRAEEDLILEESASVPNV